MPDWAHRPAWRVLDCAFGNGSRLLALRQRWRDDAQAPRMLHYAAIATAWPTLADAELSAACADLPPGIHRIALEGGRLSLTLCLGLDTAPDALAFQADQIVLPPSWLGADRWALKALARCCRRGTRVDIPAAMASDAPSALPPAWQENGFVPHPTALASFAPRWDIQRTRQTDTVWTQAPGSCAVVGAGLAGASVARALALRGWQVTVLDQAAQPAAGASGLPVGLIVPHQSADDSPRSRLSRAGIALTWAQAEAHLQAGADWSPCGVTEMRTDGEKGQRTPLWHAQAGWIKPAALVQAWLQTPGVRFQGDAPVTELARTDRAWQLRGAHGQLQAQADIVVLANAVGIQPLLQGLPLAPDMRTRLQALHAMHGTMSLGDMPDAAVPDTPVNGLGSFTPGVPGPTGRFWAAGASFESDAAALADTAAQHAYNLQRLQTLLPEVAATLEPQFAQGQVRAWRNTRCVTQDRLPWVGEVALPDQPGLWVCAGMGARGLSFSVLCAEVLAARLGGEPLPQEAALLRSVDLNRPLRRKAKS